MPETKPYGTWKSPITADLIVAEAIRLDHVWFAGGDVYWVESRPSEKGRNVLVRWGGHSEAIVPEPFSVRSRVHEYGGGSFAVGDGGVFFVNDADQQIYCQVVGESPVQVTDEPEMRFADLVVYSGGLICVREDHQGEGEPVNSLVSIDVNGGTVSRVLAEGNDFYASPGIHPDGTQICWLSWNHPNMPWDRTELWVGNLDASGGFRDTRCVVGEEGESIFQPLWGPDGRLYFVSDRNGWWNLYRWDGGVVEPLVEMDAEFGRPQWAFGMSTYGFSSGQELVCTYSREGVWEMGKIDLETNHLATLPLPYTDLSQVRVGPGTVVFRGGAPDTVSSLVQLHLDTGTAQVLRRSCDVDFDMGCVSISQTLSFPVSEKEEAYGFYYPPCNPDYRGPEDEKPPLLVKSHGGPTGATVNTLDLQIQYWTSRGFAVLDVNYGGSSGYGRAYRNRLEGHWGEVDVDDCVQGAQFLVDQGLVDGKRLVIRGGSAGGYTTLCVLTFRDLFCAGASYYGVSDLEALTRETHKFESRYLDRLIGPYPERQDLYLDRSPLQFVNQLSAPVIFFQGDEDRVVPPGQAEEMVRALDGKGIPVAYVLFEGEGHGFRQAAHMKQALEGELYFYGRVLGFEPFGPLPPVSIRNL